LRPKAPCPSSKIKLILLRWRLHNRFHFLSFF
jgi:hypothetical protein